MRQQPRGGGGSSGGSSSHGAGRRAGGGDDHGGRGHAHSHATGNARGGYDARHMIDEIRRAKKTTEVTESDGFPAYSARLVTCSSQDHQVRCKARPSSVAQVLCPVIERECPIFR
jgi:hypothetical protein